MIFLMSTNDPGQAASGNDFLHDLVAQILPYEDDIYITLADMAFSPPLVADGDNADQRTQITKGFPEPTDIEIDDQAEINQTGAAEDEPAAPPPTSEKSRDRATADAPLSAIIGADHSSSEAAPLHLA